MPVSVYTLCVPSTLGALSVCVSCCAKYNDLERQLDLCFSYVLGLWRHWLSKDGWNIFFLSKNSAQKCKIHG